MDPLLLRPAAPHPGLLLDVVDPDQRRLGGARLLPERSEGVLHHVPGTQQAVLTEPLFAAVVLASAIAGWSALYGP
jgi:hypothetical protein